MGFIETHFLLDEQEYYKFRSPKPEPKPGCYLITRRPYMDFIKVTRPDGSTKSFFLRDRAVAKKLENLGIPQEKQERILSHVMNFQSAYVRVDYAETWGTMDPVGEAA